jgi:secreted trypsin-like serine protease
MSSTKKICGVALAAVAALTVAGAVQTGPTLPGSAPVSNNGPEPIVGGEDATKPYSYMASFQSSGGHGCGATLIAKRWAVTAAHCAGGDLKQVRIGSLQTGSGGQVRKVIKQVSHPDYGKKGKPSSDIALLQLDKDSTLTPAKVPTKNPKQDVVVRLIGWGLLNVDGDEPDVLQQVDMSWLPNSKCKNVTVGDLCIDDPKKPETSACFGDSGGPALVKGADGKWQLFGATSRWGGTAGDVCEGTSVYTSTVYFRPWIEKTIGAKLP